MGIFSGMPIRRVPMEEQWHGHWNHGHHHDNCCEQPPMPPPIPSIQLDSAPTEGSLFAVQSGGTWQAIEDLRLALTSMFGDLSQLNTVDKGTIVDAINEILAEAGAALDAAYIYSIEGAVLEHSIARLVLAKYDSNIIVKADGVVVTGTQFNGNGVYIIPTTASTVTASLGGKMMYQWLKRPQEAIDYQSLVLNKPSINGVTLEGNRTSNVLGLASVEDIDGFYTKPANGIPASDLTVQIQDFRLLPANAPDGWILSRQNGYPKWVAGHITEGIQVDDTDSIDLEGMGNLASTAVKAYLRVDNTQENFLEVSADGVRSHINGALRYDIEQDLTPEQQAQAIAGLGLTADLAHDYLAVYEGALA